MYNARKRWKARAKVHLTLRWEIKLKERNLLEKHCMYITWRICNKKNLTSHVKQMWFLLTFQRFQCTSTLLSVASEVGASITSSEESCPLSLWKFALWRTRKWFDEKVFEQNCLIEIDCSDTYWKNSLRNRTHLALYSFNLSFSVNFLVMSSDELLWFVWLLTSRKAACERLLLSLVVVASNMLL